MKNSVNSVGLRLVGLALMLAVSGADANNLGENTVWQFGTAQDKVNKTAVLDQIQKKKAGYYDAMRPVYNYTTYIEKQYNCSVTSSTSANSGSSSNVSTNSSPTVSNAGTTSSSALANSASSSLSQVGPTTGALDNTQNNSGSLGSSVNGSNTNATTGAVTSGAGTSDQALNSQQNNSGVLSASVTGSTACVGPLN